MPLQDLDELKKTYNAQAVMAATIEKASESQRENTTLNLRAKQVASQFSQNAISPFVLASTLRFIEFFAIFALSAAIYSYYVLPGNTLSALYIFTCFMGSAGTVVAFQVTDAYQATTLRHTIPQLLRMLPAWTAVFAVIALFTFLFRPTTEFSRIWFTSWYLSGIAFFVVFRFIVTKIVQRWARDGRLERRAVIIGGGANAETLIRSLEEQNNNDVRICGIFDDRSGDRSPPMVAGYPKLGTITELVEFGRQARIDMLIVSLPISAESRVLSLLKKVWVLPVDIRLSAHTNKLRFRPRSYSYVGAVPFLDVFDKPIADWDSVMKRGFDIFFSLGAIVLLSPLMLAAALAIKLTSKGNVLFKQKRFGFNNEVIEVLKFRSMYSDMNDHDAKKVVTKNDARVTPVGRFIRKTSIDELPQLWNVLKGELSLVGPRPHAVNAHTENKLWDEVVDGYFGRHKVKPGVTGWAQVNGWRGEVDNAEKIRRRVEHDLFYIENWSVLFDLYILFLTPFKLLNTENAY